MLSYVRKRLAGPNPTQEILDILDKNIVCANALTYDYSLVNQLVLKNFVKKKA